MNPRLLDFLAKHRKLAVDTNIFIYQLEAHPRYSALTDVLFRWLEQPNHRAVTPTLTMTELLVHPYRKSDLASVDAFYSLLSTYPNLEWIPLTLPIADSAAGVRARYGLKTADALHAATAIQAKVSGMVTNDLKFDRVKEFETLALDQLL